MECRLASFLHLLFKRLDNDQLEVDALKNEFRLKFQSLQRACEIKSSIEISNCKKDFLNEFKQLLRFSCVDDPQSMYFHFVKEFDELVSNIEKNYDANPINSNSFVEDRANSQNSANENYFLFELSKANMKVKSELFLRKTKIQVLKGMTSVYKNETQLDQLNKFIKNEIYGQSSIDNDIKSSVKLANDVQSVINMMNQSIKTSSNIIDHID